MGPRRRPGRRRRLGGALRGCGGLLAVVLAMTGLLAAAADHITNLGNLLNLVGLDQVLPGFSVNKVLGNPSSIVGLLPTLGFSKE